MGWRDDLAAMAEREKAASPGPWRGSDRPARDVYDEGYWVDGPRGVVAGGIGGFDEDAGDKATADFIAAARTDLPALRRFAEMLVEATPHLATFGRKCATFSGLPCDCGTVKMVEEKWTAAKAGER